MSLTGGASVEVTGVVEGTIVAGGQNDPDLR